MIRFSWVVALSLFAALIVGCDDKSGSKDGKSQTSKDASGKFRVAMILPGSENDAGWNQLAREGLDRIKAELKADVHLVAQVKTNEMANQARYCADEGYDVVICHGYEFGTVVAGLAANYPKVHFIVGGYSDPIPGAVAVEFVTTDASKLVGIVAANVTKTKKVGFIGGEAVPPVEACYNGMKDGVTMSGKDSIEVLKPLWAGWDSPKVLCEKAENMLASGADVIYQNVDAAAIGVFQGVQEAAKQGKTVYAFGCNRNQNDVAPDVILGSVAIDVPKAYLDITKEAMDKKWNSRAAKLGLKEGYVDLVLNLKHPAITSDIQSAVDTAHKGLTSAAAKLVP